MHHAMHLSVRTYLSQTQLDAILSFAHHLSNIFRYLNFKLILEKTLVLPTNTTNMSCLGRMVAEAVIGNRWVRDLLGALTVQVFLDSLRI
jgi:hypothetical protein